MKRLLLPLAREYAWLLICCAALSTWCGCKGQSPPGQDPFFGRVTAPPPPTGAATGTYYGTPNYSGAAPPGWPAAATANPAAAAPGAYPASAPGWPAAGTPAAPAAANYAAAPGYARPTTGGWVPPNTAPPGYPAGTNYAATPPGYGTPPPNYGGAAPYGAAPGYNTAPNPAWATPRSGAPTMPAVPVSQPGTPGAFTPSPGTSAMPPASNYNYQGAAVNPAYGANYGRPAAATVATAAAAPNAAPGDTVRIVDNSGRPRTLGSFVGASAERPASGAATPAPGTAAAAVPNGYDANGALAGRQTIVRTLQPRGITGEAPVATGTYGAPTPARPPAVGSPAVPGPTAGGGLQATDINDLPDARSSTSTAAPGRAGGCC